MNIAGINHKFKALLILSLSTLLLTGCGGGGGSTSPSPSGGGIPAGDADDQTLTGVFIDGPVAGLRFITPSQSGLTNSNGEFTYLAGETVTFSIGGIVLGSALAADLLNPFDLFGIVPPSTEAEIRAELAPHDKVTDFDRVANIAMLLVSLDNDSDPDNGLDLSGWDATLANASLSFDANLYNFRQENFDVFADEYGVNIGVVITSPLVHLYESLGIEIMISARSLTTVDDGNDGVVDSVGSYSYIDGLQSEYTRDDGGNGVFDFQSLSLYNLAGNRVSYYRIKDDDDDGAADNIEVFRHTYDSYGNTLTRLEEKDTDGDDKADSDTAYVYTYDDEGNILTAFHEVDADYDGVIDRNGSINYSYDESGNIISRVMEIDHHNDDGVVDITISTFNQYDGKGNKLEEGTARDSDGDGVVDRRSLYIYTYDNSGNKLSSLYEVDENNDSIIDSSANTTYKYDDEGNVMSSIRNSDTDGVNDSITFHYYTYDNRRNKLSSLRENDTNADGSGDSFSLNVYTYDDNDNEVTHLYELDDNADGLTDRSVSKTYTYDERGNKLTYIDERDDDGNGIVDSRNSETYTYDANNNQLTFLDERDDDAADGLVGEITFTEYSYTLLSEGLQYLINDQREDQKLPSFVYTIY